VLTGGAAFGAALLYASSLRQPEVERSPFVTVRPEGIDAPLQQPVVGELLVSAGVELSQRAWTGVVTSVDFEIGSAVFGPLVRLYAVHEDAYDVGRSIFEMNGRHSEDAQSDYQQVVNELLTHLERAA
jgi:hypothetical protein